MFSWGGGFPASPQTLKGGVGERASCSVGSMDTRYQHPKLFKGLQKCLSYGERKHANGSKVRQQQNQITKFFIKCL